jgi:uncharacterized protein YutE (UPF0331/DUF86 family)
VDRVLIQEKLESLRRCLERVRQRCPDTAEALAADPDAQDILTLNLTRAIQLCVDIGAHLVAERDVPAPNTMGETFQVLVDAAILEPELGHRMRQAVGFRNIAIHNYEAIDWGIVYDICHNRRADFRKFAAAMAQALEEPGGFTPGD